MKKMFFGECSRKLRKMIVSNVVFTLQQISDAAEDCRALFCGFTDRLPLD
jgi:hypothetical protein